MTTPDLLTTVGFEKSKIGAGDKEVGYQIKESSLSTIAGSACICFAIMGLIFVSLLYEVRFDRKNFHRDMRKAEHHAASKLAHVQMELWSQYRDTVTESQEASHVLKTLDAEYSQWESKIQKAIIGLAPEFNMNEDKAKGFADKVLHIVADMQQDNIKHSKHLLDHLVAAGKRSKALEKHIDSELMKNTEEERERIVEDVKEGVPLAAIEEEVKPSDSDDHKAAENLDPLKQMLEGFFYIFNDYEREFSGKPRKVLKEGNKVYDALKVLWEKINSETPPAEEDVTKELDAIDLESIGAPLGSGRVLPVDDIVEELLMIPDIPHKQIAALEKAWRSGSQDSVTVLAQLEEWHKSHKVPSGWLQMGVNKEEDADEREEEIDEKEEDDEKENDDEDEKAKGGGLRGA